MSAPRIEIYSKWGCPYCVQATALLEGKGVPYVEHDITLGGPRKAEMLERVPSALTVPQIFIGSTAVGGCDDLHALDRAGKLDSMLGLCPP